MRQSCIISQPISTSQLLRPKFEPQPHTFSNIINYRDSHALIFSLFEANKLHLNTSNLTLSKKWLYWCQTWVQCRVIADLMCTIFEYFKKLLVCDSQAPNCNRPALLSFSSPILDLNHTPPSASPLVEADKLRLDKSSPRPVKRWLLARPELNADLGYAKMR